MTSRTHETKIITATDSVTHLLISAVLEIKFCSILLQLMFFFCRLAALHAAWRLVAVVTPLEACLRCISCVGLQVHKVVNRCLSISCHLHSLQRSADRLRFLIVAVDDLGPEADQQSARTRDTDLRRAAGSDLLSTASQPHSSLLQFENRGNNSLQCIHHSQPSELLLGDRGAHSSRINSITLLRVRLRAVRIRKKPMQY